jgi:copper chaperone CopZ
LRNRGHEAFAIFEAPGMNVSGRAEKLKSDFGKLDGILEIEINYILDTVTIRYDPEKLTLAYLRNKLKTSEP